jgi:tRNA uridine 5-carbamoylmethylation protein Kti12
MVREILVLFLFLFDCYLFIAPKILIIGPPASGRHTIGKMLQKKISAVIIEQDEVLRDAPSRFKEQLPPNPTVVCSVKYDCVKRMFFSSSIE